MEAYSPFKSVGQFFEQKLVSKESFMLVAQCVTTLRVQLNLLQ